MYDIHPIAHWDEDLLIPVVELNELLLTVLRAKAAGPAPRAPRLVAELRALWRTVDDAALQRLARCPYLLLDAGFSRPACWEGGVADSAAPGYFDDEDGVSVVRHALVFARYLARSHRLSARVLLALAPECAERLAGRSLQQLEALAGLPPAWITPRWEGHIRVWRQMLHAAVDGQEELLQRTQARGLQLMATLW